MTDAHDPYAEIRPRNYYDDLGEEEWDRLDRSTKARFEFENTTDYLEEHLPPVGHVLDVGGGAGRYAVWLAERGYRVTLADLSERQASIAREKAGEHGHADAISVVRGDVRQLPFGDDHFDATLCLGGPLSHVVDELERREAVRELTRATDAGGPVLASVMGFVAVVQNLIKVGGDFPAGVRQLPGLVETGTYSESLIEAAGVEDPTFVACHFFRTDELRELLESGGVRVETIAGLEGPASNFDEEVEEIDPALRENVAAVVRELREDPTIADLSNHILAVGYTRD